MPFMLYDAAQETNCRLYTFIKNIQIAGKWGPLASFVGKQDTSQKTYLT